MPQRTRRTLRVLAMAVPLRAYATSLQSDVNAAFMLVHHALANAFATRGEDHAEGCTTESQLRDDMARRHAGDRKAKADGSAAHAPR